MRISSQQNIEPTVITNEVQSSSVEKIESRGSVEATSSIAIEKSAVTEEKLKKAVDSFNEFLEINNNALKFVYHEGLGEIVDKETEEVIKELPPKKLLDAFYEMQKLVGMIVDEKI